MGTSEDDLKEDETCIKFYITRRKAAFLQLHFQLHFN
jgi:hypothetical protein